MFTSGIHLCLYTSYIYIYVYVIIIYIIDVTIRYISMFVYIIYIYLCICIHHTYTGWQRLKGSPKLQIIFLKRVIKYRSLLRKMTHKDKGSYESSPPCIYICMHHKYIHIPIYAYNMHRCIHHIYIYISIYKYR